MIETIELKTRSREMVLSLVPQGAVSLSYARLRAACKCSGCEAQRRSGVEPNVAQDIDLLEAKPLGDHALNLCFSDGHERGIYPFAYLEELALATR